MRIHHIYFTLAPALPVVVVVVVASMSLDEISAQILCCAWPTVEETAMYCRQTDRGTVAQALAAVLLIISPQH